MLGIKLGIRVKSVTYGRVDFMQIGRNDLGEAIQPRLVWLLGVNFYGIFLLKDEKEAVVRHLKVNKKSLAKDDFGPIIGLLLPIFIRIYVN